MQHTPPPAHTTMAALPAWHQLAQGANAINVSSVAPATNHSRHLYMHYEQLQRTDIPQIWTIDRSEIIDQIYVVQDGIMVLQDAPFVAHGWPPNTPEQATPTLIACYDRGGDFWAAWDGTQLAGIAVLDHQPVTSRPDLLQLLFLHVGRPYRGSGVGEHLFRHAQAVARQWGAAGLYVSATPTRRTIAFYQRMGCRLMTQPDPTLFAEEPEDLHLECGL